jgi:hypothetical protein
MMRLFVIFGGWSFNGDGRLFFPIVGVIYIVDCGLLRGGDWYWVVFWKIYFEWIFFFDNIYYVILFIKW